MYLFVFLNFKNGNHANILQYLLDDIKEGCDTSYELIEAQLKILFSNMNNQFVFM